MSDFDFLEPTKIADAVRLLEQHPGQVSILAGGTDLIPRLNQRLRRPAFLLDLAMLPDLNGVTYRSGEDLQIGAMTPLQALEKSPIIRKTFTALAEAAASVATPQVRNLGTIGGNVCQDVRCWFLNQPDDWRASLPACRKLGGDTCHVSKNGKRCVAISYSDTFPALMVLEAKATIISPKRQRVASLSDLASRGETPGLSQDEILLEVVVPGRPGKSGSAYCRHNLRRAIDFPAVAVAAMVEIEGSLCRKVRLALGAVAPSPYRVLEAEEALLGTELNDKTIAEASRVVGEKARYLSDLYYTPEYKRRLVEVLASRALAAAAERARLS